MAQMNAGNYLGRLVEAGTAEDAKAQPYLFLKWAITHEWNAQANGGVGDWIEILEFERQSRKYLTEKVWNSPDAVDYLMRDLDALGFNSDFGSPQFNADLYEGNVILVCSHNVSKDGSKTYERWEPELWKSGGNGPENKPAEAGTIRRLNALLRSKAGNKPAPSTAKATPPPPRTQAEPPADESGVVHEDEDSIPF